MFKFNFYMAMFIIVALAVIAGGSMTLFKREMTLSALIFLAGSLYLFSIFGIKWFNPSGGIFSETPVPWPPTINTCPDFLMYYKRKKSDGTVTDTCVDPIGVSKTGALQIFPADGNVNTDNDAYFFPLTTTKSDTVGKNAELCQQCLKYGLTWEGICNGESCVSPPANGGSGGNGGGGNGGCPS